MATTVTKIIDPDNGSGTDYTSLAAWEAGQQGDLTGVRDEIAVAKCRCTGGTADTTAVTIDGWTTSSTQYIKIWTDPSESYRHSGKWETGNKYRMYADAVLLNVTGADHIIIDGLQFGYPPGAGNCGCLATMNMTGWAHIRNNVVWGGTSPSNAFGIAVWSSNQYIYNNIIMDFSDHSGTFYYGIKQESESPYPAAIYNNTIINCYVGIWSVSNGGNGYDALKNNILYNCTTPIIGTFAAGSGYNATEDASLGASYSVYGGATGDRTSQTFSFVGSGDYHLQSSDTGARGLGTNLYNDAICPFQTDIDGQDRGGSGAQWDIGADEYVAAASSTRVPFRRMNVLLRLCLSTFNLIWRCFK